VSLPESESRGSSYAATPDAMPEVIWAYTPDPIEDVPTCPAPLN
jgi:hypothetical protein